MTQVQGCIDGLWLCLRPALYKYAATSLGSTPISIGLSFSRESRLAPRLARKGRSRNISCFSTSASTSRPIQLPRRVPVESPNGRELKNRAQELIAPGRGTDALYRDLEYASLSGDYLRVRILVEALVKERGEEPNLPLYLGLILANTNPQHGSPAEVKSLLEEMGPEGLIPDSSIYHAIIKVLAIHPDYLFRKDILEELHQRWFTLTNDGWHNVMAGMVRDRQLELVLNTVDLLHAEGTQIKPWLYDLITYTLCDVEEFDEALKIMRYRISAGELLISATLWSYILDAASRALHHEATLYVWRKRVETSYLNPPSGICINVLSTAARHGNFLLATDVFRILGNRTETLQHHHFESLMEAYLAASDLQTALTILTVMTSSGVAPTESSVRPIYLHLCQDPSLPATALSILRDLHSSKRPIPPSAINAIIESHIHHENLPSAVSVYKTLHKLCPQGPTVSTFNTLFRGCAKFARRDQAMYLAAEMVTLQVAPDALTYDRLILVCLNFRGAEKEQHEAFLDAWKYFEEMRSVDLWPRQGTVVALAKRCCERGDERVWGLVGSGGHKGMGTREMENFVSDHWRAMPRLSE